MIEITPQLIDSFRADKPAFSDDTKWPDDFITSALIEADVETGGQDGVGLKIMAITSKGAACSYLPPIG